jgi:chromosome segregation ATPase
MDKLNSLGSSLNQVTGNRTHSSSRYIGKKWCSITREPLQLPNGICAVISVVAAVISYLFATVLWLQIAAPTFFSGISLLLCCNCRKIHVLMPEYTREQNLNREKSAIKKLDGETDQLEDEIKSSNQKVAELAVVIDEGMRLNAEEGKEVTEETKNLLGITATINTTATLVRSASKSNIQGTKENIEFLKKELNERIEENRKLSGEITKLKEQNNKLEKITHVTVKESDEFESSVETLEKHNNQARALSEQFTLQIPLLEQTNRKLTQDKETLQKRLDHLTQVSEQQLKEIQRLQQEILKLETTASELKAALVEATKALREDADSPASSIK